MRRSSSLYAGTTRLISRVAGSMAPVRIVFAGQESLFETEASRCATQESYQQVRGLVSVVPDGVVVMYVFSDGYGGLGTGATRRRRAYI